MFFLHVFLTVFMLESCFCTDLNIGTCLFTKYDLYKQCWGHEQLALLTSRMIFEDLLPNPMIIKIESNDFVYNLIEYFKIILNIIRNDTNGRTKHVTLIALGDILGGYLHHTVLPIARYAYYAGFIDFETIDLLMRFFHELKYFLRTNGIGWADPIDAQCNYITAEEDDNNNNDKIKLAPIHFDKNPNADEGDDDSVCDDLIIFNENDKKNLTIPLPFFDSITQPTTIALPYRNRQVLYNLFVGSSANLLIDFYRRCFKCLQQKNVDLTQIEHFRTRFLRWINHEVLPRLNDPVLYAAFGGVLRLRYTLKTIGTMGLKEKEEQLIKHHSIKSMSRKKMIITVILIMLLVWFILGLLFICYRLLLARRKRHRNYCDPKCPGVGDNKSTTATDLSSKSSKYFFPESGKCSSCKRTPTDLEDVTSASDDYTTKTKKKQSKKRAVIETTHTEKYVPSSSAAAGAAETTKRSKRFALCGGKSKKDDPKPVTTICCEKCNCSSIDFTTSDSSGVADYSRMDTLPVGNVLDIEDSRQYQM